MREAGKKQKKGGKLDNGDDEVKKEYIHVRARRGQATDSHSLAERVFLIISFLLSHLSFF